MQGPIIEQETKRATKPEASRQVKITFKPEAVDYIPNLLGMVNSGIIKLSLRDAVVLTTAVKFRKWEHDDDRTVVITLTDTFDREYFVDMLYRALENIEAVTN